MTPAILYGLVLLAAASGVGITTYIRTKKRSHTALVCPMGADCDTVIQSDFSRFLGVPVEIIGFLYYLLILLAYGSMLLVPAVSEAMVSSVLFPVTLTAFLFSAYLTFIQAVTLKQYCTWCLGSALLSTIIFFVSVWGLPWGTIMPLMAAWRPAMLGIHLMGLALGLGGATVADVLFFRFLRDLRISHFESEMLKSVSQVIWAGLGLLVVSGMGLFLADPARLIESDKFLANMVVIGVIIINGAFLNLYITPKLVHINFGDPHRNFTGQLRRERRIAFALSAVSITSWYSAFTLALLAASPLPFGPLLAVYAAIVLLAVGGSQVIERIVARRGWQG